MQGFPKTREKELIAVRYDVQRQAVLAIPVVKEQHGKLFSCDVVAARQNRTSALSLSVIVTIML